MEVTTRFSLPLLAAGQAQKELFHNEALLRLDTLLHPIAEAMGIEMPPSGPQPGQMWIVGAAPIAEWSGAAGQLARWSEAGWRFIAPLEGLAVTLRESGLRVIWRDGAWQVGIVTADEIVVGGQRVVGPRQPAIADPTGGSVVDEAARATIAQVLVALRAHGLLDG